MATDLFFLDTNQTDLIASELDKVLSLSRGASAVSKVVTATAAGNNIQWTDGAGGTALVWLTNPLQAVTISGAISANIRGLESANTVNSGVSLEIRKYVAADGTTPSIGTTTTSTEFTTSETAKSVTLAAPTSQTLVDGDRLLIRVRLRSVGTMGAGTATLFINGPTSGASGDTFVTFTETILEQVIASDDFPAGRVRAGRHFIRR